MWASDRSPKVESPRRLSLARWRSAHFFEVAQRPHDLPRQLSGPGRAARAMETTALPIDQLVPFRRLAAGVKCFSGLERSSGCAGAVAPCTDIQCSGADKR